MCGIHGIVSFGDDPEENLQEKIDLMLERSDHRGPDESDTLVFDQAAMGMNRLAILVPQENLTIQSDKGRDVHIVFNGEIVNYKELSAELSIPPQKEGDTGVIFPLWQEFGEDFIKKLAGMFSIALFDEKKRELRLWRDPLGVKPLYYYYLDNLVIFSSEIKSIYAVLAKKPEVDFTAVDHMLKYRFHPGRTTIFSEIHRVLPGEAIIFRKNEIIHQQYWKLKENSTTSVKNADIESFRKLFSKVVEQNLLGDVKGGYFVSGGLDSSLVTSMALQTDSQYQQPISIRFTPQPVIDEGYGKHLEKFLNKNFEWVEISDEDARQGLEELVFFLDEPLENPIHIGTYFMAKRANELGIKSVLTGDGSDEFFLGYARQACWFLGKEDPIEAYPKWLWTLKPEEAEELYTDDSKKKIIPMVNTIGEPVEPFMNVEQALYFERLDRLSEYHCMRLDRMTMAFGVEAKVPFLDHRIVDFTFQLSLKDLFGESGKGWLQKVAEPWVPKEIIKRQKVHFPSLADQWVSGKGLPWIKSILLTKEARVSKWFKQEVIERYIYEHESGQKKRGRLLWALAVLELWLRVVESW